MIPHETILNKKGKTPWRVIDDEAVIVDLKSNTVLQLNDVGRFIWESIDGEVSIGEILDQIYDTYDSDKETIRDDSEQFLNVLMGKGLVYDVHTVGKSCRDSI